MRPAIVVQDDWLLATSINTVLVVPLTSNVALEPFPGNVLIPAASSSLERDSVAVISQIGPVDRSVVDPYPAGRVPAYLMAKLADGIRLVLGF